MSRVLTGGDVTAALMRVPLSLAVGFTGIFSTLKGGRAVGHAGRTREGHVGAKERAAHAILAEAGPHSAIALFRCTDREMWQEVSERAAERGINSWQGTLTEFLAALDPGSHHWVRAALAEPSKSDGVSG